MVINYVGTIRNNEDRLAFVAKTVNQEINI